MQSSISRAIKQNILYALGIFVMKSVSFFMLPFIAHSLSPEDFGRMEILNSLGAIGAIIVGFGLLNTLFRYASDRQDPDKSAAIAAEIYGLNISIGVVMLIAGLVLSDWLTALIPGNLSNYSVRLMIGIIALEACICIPLGWLRMKERAAVFFLINVKRASLQAGLVVLFINHGRGIEGVFEAGFIAAASQAIILCVLQNEQTGLKFVSPRFKSILYYSFPMVGSGLLGFILNGLDRWLLADAAGTAQLAEYAMAAKFAMIAALLLQPFLMWWSPRRFQVLQEHDGKSKAAQFAALGSCLSLMIAVLVSLTAPLFIETLLPVSYWGASQYIPWLVLIVVLKDSAELLNLGCYTGKSTNAQFLINLAGSMLGFICMLITIPIWQVWGVIISLVFAQFVRLVLYVLISQKKLRLPYPVGSLLIFSAISVLLLFIGSVLEGTMTRVVYLIGGILILGFFLYRFSPLMPRATKLTVT